MRLEDLGGRVFSRLTVVRRAPRRAGSHSTHWVCRCECGRESVASASNLKTGVTRSCGCLKDEKTAARLRTHGMSTRPEYWIWSAARERCTNSKDASYRRYGGRGITMCDAWQKSFGAFFADMGPRPVGYTLDRRDNNGPYDATNCRWAPPAVQARNQERNHWIEFRGERRVMQDWAAEMPVGVPTFYARLKRGWTVERAMTTPPLRRG